jgi:hypothetical protein
MQALPGVAPGADWRLGHPLGSGRASPTQAAVSVMPLTGRPKSRETSRLRGSTRGTAAQRKLSLEHCQVLANGAVLRAQLGHLGRFGLLLGGPAGCSPLEDLGLLVSGPHGDLGQIEGSGHLAGAILPALAQRKDLSLERRMNQ